MTGPKPSDFAGPFNYDSQARAMSGEIDSAIAGTEFSAFMARRKELLDAMMATAQMGHPLTDPARHVDPEATNTTMVPVVPGSTLSKPTPEQIGQAHFWQIANPEQMSAAELQHQIDQRRADVPKEDRTSLTSALFAGGAAAAASAGSAAELINHAFENVGAAVDQIPFVGHALSSMVSNEQSKLFWQTLQARSAEAVEAASAMQPDSDRGAFQFLTGAGKMAGYALPAVAAWEGLGAAAGIPRLSWAAQAGTPLLRAAAKGALTAALLQDPDAPTDSKVMNIGLGAIMGGSSMWGRVGASIGLGTVGAGIGSQIGDTPEERTRHALEFGVGGATLPFLAPALANAFLKVKNAIPDGSIPAEGWTPPGTSDAEWSFEHDAPQVSGNPVPKTLLANPDVEGGLPSTPSQLHALISGEQESTVASPTATPSTGSTGIIPQSESTVAGYLQPPVDHDNMSERYYGAIEHADQFREFIKNGTIYDPQAGYVNRPEMLDQPIGDAVVRGHVTLGTDPATTWRDYYNNIIQRSENQALGFRYQDRELQRAKNSLTGIVTNGPAHLQGSMVATADGTPLRVYHGTASDFGDFDLSKADSTALYGAGLYHTESISIANGYTGDIAQVVNDPTRERQALQELNGLLNSTDISIVQRAQSAKASLLGMAGAEPLNEEMLTSLGIDTTGLISYKNPNVRPAFLDIKQPFNIDQRFTRDEAMQFVDRLEAGNPGFNWNALRDRISAASEPTGAKLEGNDLYHYVQTTPLEVQHVGPEPHSADMWKLAQTSDDLEAPTIIGDSTNAVLARGGFDGITHIGGLRTGNPPHRVWIAFDPAQVHPYFTQKSLGLDEAINTANAVTKQATLMESAHLPQAVGKVQMDESDVVDAIKLNNPGGVSIVQGVGDPMSVLRAHPDVQFVERDGRLDALVGEFTDEMVADYKRFGTYEGNVVTTLSGIEAEVVSINGKGMATLKRSSGGPPLRVKVENLLPSRYADPVYTGADVWPAFKVDFFKYVNREMNNAGMAPVTSLFDPRAGSLLQGHVNDFLNREGITDPGTRHALDLLINQSYVNEARDLDPESRNLQERLGNEATVEMNDDAESIMPIAVSLEEHAEPRGFIWLSNPGADGGILRDTLNPEGATEIPMETDEAAETFLNRVDRSAPDLTPAGDVPADAMEFAPTGATFEPRIGHEETEDTFEEDNAEDDKALDDLEGNQLPPSFVTKNPDGSSSYDLEGHLNYLASLAAGGGSEPPIPPELPSGASGFGGGQPLLGGRETLGGQFQRLYRDSPEKWAELQRKWSGNHLRYTRYMMAALENDLAKAGVDLGTAWRDVEALETARTKADNESYDWLKESGEILRSFGSKRKINPLFRNGFITRTHEITDPAERFRRWWGLEQKGFSKDEIRQMIAADDKLTDLYHRLFMSGVESPSINFRPEQEINRYMSHVRQRQAQGNINGDPYDHRGLLSPEVQFFAEYAREGNMQFRVMDTRALLNHYIRAMMFKKYQAVPYENLVSKWQDRRVPEEISNLLTDHARAMRFGYKPEPTLAIKAVRGMIEGMVGVPITTSEAARITAGPLGWMYRSLLGGKTSIFFRDATQPLMALTKVRVNHMAEAYKDVLGYWRGGAGRDKMLEAYDTALRHGWVSRERPAMESLSTFEQQAGSDNELLGLTPAQAAARERAARLGDRLPHWLERADDKINTLRLYSKEQRLNQFIPGLAAYRQAKLGLSEYRRSVVEAALAGDPSRAMNYDDFARRSFFSSFEPAVQNRLRQLVDSNQDEEAAATFAREVVKWSQHVYTVREKPKVLRGGFGKFASFLGNWSGQFLEAVHSSMRWGKPEHMARALMVIGGFSYAMKKLGDQLGMRNLSNWAWTSALHYAGSPFLEAAAHATLAYAGAMSLAEDRKPSPLQGEAIKDVGQMPVATEFFPYSGYIKSADAIVKAAQGTDPAGDITRFMVSGDRGSRVNFLLQSRQRADALKTRLEGTPLGSPHPGTGARQ